MHASEGTISRFSEGNEQCFCAAKVLSRPCLSWVKMRRTRIEHMSAGLPPITDIARRGWHGRKSAISRLMHCSKQYLYSITSWARCRIEVGTSMPKRLSECELVHRLFCAPY